MRILQIINSLDMGGAETLLMEYAPLLIKKGVETDILSLKAVSGEILSLMEQKGVCVTSLNVGNIYNPIVCLKLLKYIDRYDLIHVHLFPAQYWVVFAKLLKCSKTSLITTEHNTTNRRREIPLFQIIDRFVYSKYLKIICISKKANDKLVAYVPSMHDKVKTVCNGVNVSRFEKALPIDRIERFQLASDVVVVTMVAGFREQKDQDTLIRAIALLPENFHLFLVGDGIRRKKCEKIADAIGIKNRVHFLGIRSDISQLLKMSDIIVLSSFFEGLSLSSIEGMASGRPFVASNVDGLQDIVQGAGLLFQRGDERELVDILFHLSIDKEFAISVGEKCSARAKEYDIEIMVNKYLEIYHQV